MTGCGMNCHCLSGHALKNAVRQCVWAEGPVGAVIHIRLLSREPWSIHIVPVPRDRNRTAELRNTGRKLRGDCQIGIENKPGLSADNCTTEDLARVVCRK